MLAARDSGSDLAVNSFDLQYCSFFGYVAVQQISRIKLSVYTGNGLSTNIKLYCNSYGDINNISIVSTNQCDVCAWTRFGAAFAHFRYRCTELLLSHLSVTLLCINPNFMAKSRFDEMMICYLGGFSMLNQFDPDYE